MSEGESEHEEVEEIEPENKSGLFFLYIWILLINKRNNFLENEGGEEEEEEKSEHGEEEAEEEVWEYF